jgi:ABC-type glycerol-3-phosphate transport system permease component
MEYEYTSWHFMLYVGRWMLSAVVMMAPLFLLRFTKITNEYLKLFIVQVIGAFIFYKLDAYLFT